MNIKALVISLLLLCFNRIQLQAQNCFPTCKTTYNNSSSNITVNATDIVCITGTYTGTITMNGGIVHMCATSTSMTLHFTLNSLFIAEEGASLTAVKLTQTAPLNIENHGTMIITAANTNQPLTLLNKGNFKVKNGGFNSDLTITNEDTLTFTPNMTFDRPTAINNSGAIYFEANVTFKSTLTLNNNCQIWMNGNWQQDGQAISVSGGYLYIKALDLRGGSITLENATYMHFITSMKTSGTGFIDGVGQRSTIKSDVNPSLGVANSVRGQIALCAPAGYVPQAGRIGPGAILSCDNAIGGSPCNPEPFGYDLYRMVPITSSAWTDTATWETYTSTGWKPASGGRYPGIGSAAIIGDGKTMHVTSDLKVRKITLGETSGGGQLVVDNASAFTILDTLELKGSNSMISNASGGLSINGQIIGGNMKLSGGSGSVLNLSLKNTTCQLQMDATNASSKKLKSLTYNLPGTLSLQDTLKVVSGIYPKGGTLQTNDKLVLLSDAISTASISTGIGAYISGKVAVQRFIPAVARRYRFLTPPVNGSNLLDWQQEVFITGNNSVGLATGTAIGQLNSAGFDATPSNISSLYLYDESMTGNLNYGWKAISNETNTLADVSLQTGKGYRLFIRGDRSDLGRLDGSNNTQNEVTLEMWGTINTGNVVLPVTYTTSTGLADDGWNLVGNPYPSAFDWPSFYNSTSGVKQNLDPTIWIYNPRWNAYVSYNVAAGAGSLTDGIIPSGQSFWVKANGANPALTVTEDFKVLDTSTIYLNAGSIPGGAFDQTNQISIKLIKDSINADEVIIKYKDGALKTYDYFDILKLWGGSIGIASFDPSDSIYLDLSSRSLDYNQADIVPIYFYVDVSATYVLAMNLSAQTILPGSKAYLWDHYTNKYINITTNSLYSFAVDMNDPASSGYDRFYIIYFPADPVVTNVTYLFAEKENGNRIKVKWGSNNETFPTTYEVQRGYLLNVLDSIGTVPGTGNRYLGGDYELVDSTMNLAVPVYYRIAYSDSVNGERYSTTIMVNHTKVKEAVSLQQQLRVYPNPVNDLLQITYNDKAYHGNMTVLVQDITGKEKMNIQLEDPLPNGALILDMQALNSGLYFIQLVNAAGQKAYFKVMKN